MRAIGTSVAGVAVIAAVTLFACTDLFHSTSDFQNACQIDADTKGCDAICVTDSAQARALAETACAYLGDCALPMGQNQFGTCVFEATLAYDCNANPNRTVQGRARAIWDCMKSAASCDDVSRCIGAETCKQGPIAPVCSPADPALRVTCSASLAGGYENCAAWGLTCQDGVCSGEAPPDAGPPACAGGTSCMGTTLRACTDGGAQAIDCTDFGTGTCVGTPGGAACVGDHGASCPPSSIVRCNGDVATGCPRGVEETVDCSLLTGPGSCRDQTQASAALGVAEACGAAAPPCAPDSCAGTILSSCFRGKTYTVDCAKVGGHCALTPTADGTRAACVP
jgi:hypothetical protein